MISFLIDAGMGMDYCPFSSLFVTSLMGGRWSGRWKLSEEVILQDIMRKMLSRAPDGIFDFINDFYFDQHNMQRPLSQLFLQHNLFQAADSPAETDHGGYIHLHENKRMMPLDPYGQRVQCILEQTKQLHYILHDPDKTCSTYDFGPYSALFVLLDIYNKDRSSEFQSSCLNRLVLFLQLQRELDLETKELVWAEDRQGVDRRMTVTEFALAREVTELWIEALKLAGWSDFDIIHLWDECTYCGVPELVDDQVWYQTRREWWKEAKAALYLGITDFEESFSRNFPMKSRSARKP